MIRRESWPHGLTLPCESERSTRLRVTAERHVGEGRSQLVLAVREKLDDVERAGVASPFAKAEGADVLDVLEAAGDFLAGGVVKTDELGCGTRFL